MTSTTRLYTETLNRLTQARLRPTRQRIALAQLLFIQGNRHVTAEQLHEEAVANGVRVSLATVYNALHQFTAVGFLQQVVVNSGCTYFDTNVATHYHFLHEESGTLSDIPVDTIRLEALPAAPQDTKISQVDIIIRLRAISRVE